MIKCDVIVNPANSALHHGAGVARAIATAGGTTVIKESRAIIDAEGFVPTTCNVVTSAGSMPCRAIIHAVGPCRNDYKTEHSCLKDLNTTFVNCLKTVNENNFYSVAIPPISAGLFGVSRKQVAKVLMTSILDFLNEHTNTSIEEIYVVDINDDILKDVKMKLHACSFYTKLL